MMFNRQNSLWMGDLDPYMDENFVKQAFSAMGESPLGVKIITHRITGGSAGYCFVELADEASVDRCVQRLNGKLVPGSNPPRKFKLNYATYGKRPEAGPEFSVFVGDVASEVDDFQLHQVFKKYPSCKGAKVVTDQYGYSNQKTSYPGGQSQSYSSYNPTQSGYYGSHAAGGQGGYYPQWGGYDQYSGYNSGYGGYHSGYNSGYNGSYNSGYNYNYGAYGYPPPGQMMPTPPMGMPPMSADMSGAVEGQEQAEDVDDDNPEEPIPECDVELWNKDFMQHSEELYEALMNCHWEPLDSVDSPIPTLS
uniref:tRNA selenocysteine-associated protein 1 n=1 Tax=Fundulus heteroclitus TaxID=8078 RepID=A0A3Q2TWW7_FUNHE